MEGNFGKGDGAMMKRGSGVKDLSRTRKPSTGRLVV